MAGLQSGEGCMTIDSVVWAQYINVTDTQTDSHVAIANAAPTRCVGWHKRCRPLACVHSWSERLDQALASKENGNVRFRSGNYSGAIGKYKQALTSLDTGDEHEGSDQTFQPSSEEIETWKRLFVDCHNNLAGDTSGVDMQGV